jgi:hypothetical protein
MRIVNVRVSEEARAALLSRIEQIAREYSDQACTLSSIVAGTALAYYRVPGGPSISRAA